MSEKNTQVDRINPRAERNLPGFHTYNLDNYEHFSEIVAEHFQGNTDYVWRGHRLAAWRLESSLGRPLLNQPNKGTPRPAWDRKITQLTTNHLLAYLRRLCRVEGLPLEYRNLYDKVGDGGNSSDYSFLTSLGRLTTPERGLLFELLARGQHHELLTDLLDWSQSPFIALHFAFEAKGDEEDGVGNRVVYALNQRLLAETCPQKEWKESGVYLVESLAFSNKRIVGQAGLFTYSPSHASIEDWVVDHSEPNPEAPLLLRFRIRNTKRTECLKWLESMNIGHQAIYPDWHGAAKAANEDLEKELKKSANP